MAIYFVPARVSIPRSLHLQGRYFSMIPFQTNIFVLYPRVSCKRPAVKKVSKRRSIPKNPTGGNLAQLEIIVDNEFFLFVRCFVVHQHACVHKDLIVPKSTLIKRALG